MKSRLYAIPLALLGLALIAVAGAVLAENIDPNNDNSQFAWSENAGWVNAEPANCSNCGVHVTNTGLTGYMWGENLGWINLSCQNNNTCAGPAGNWGVTNNGSGALAGYAWAENAGWISFSCQSNPATCASTGNYGVSIDPGTGVFSGHAWGENIGWISFSDASPIAYKIQTSDTDADGVFAGSDNCPGVSNVGQANGDGDAFGDACDACPATGDPAACADDDNDGFTDGDEAAIGTNAGYPCGFNSWPADLWDQPPFSANKITVQDLTAFIAPVRRLGTNPGDANFSARWDIVPGKGIFSVTINVQDMTRLVTLAPPMLNGARALNGPVCPMPSQ